jgi:PAS domain S-box-containing protein
MSEKIKILYIDDDEANLRAFHRVYRNHYEIQSATSAQAGLELIQHDHFHILLVDQRMPNMTGVEFFTKLPKEIYSIKILITGYTDINDLIGAINKGHIYKYIHKPYKKEPLMKVLNEAYHVYCYRKNQRDDFYKYKEVFTNSSDPIFLVSQSGKIIDVNSPFLKLLSTSRNQIINKLYTDIFEKNDLNPKLIVRLRSGEKLENIEVNLQVDEKKSVECLISLKQINVDSNKLIGYQILVRNISDYKALTRTLLRNIIRKQEKEKEQISYTLHENTAQNLSAIKLYMNILSTGNGSKEMTTSTKETIDNTIKELRDMCFKLMPRSLFLDTKGTFTSLCEKIKETHHIDCHLIIEGELSTLNKDLTIILFKKTKETLTHIKKTDNIKVIIKVTDQHLTLEIEGKKIELSPLEINSLYTEIDSYQGNITINNLEKNLIRYSMSFPIVIAAL